jgi:hypothetical protein
MAALALGAVSITLTLSGGATAEAATTCNSHVVANTFVAFRIAVVDPVSCDEARAAIGSFLAHGFAQGWRCDEQYVVPHQVTCWPDGRSGRLFFAYRPLEGRTRGVTSSLGFAPLPGRYVGPGRPGHEISFGFDGRRSVVFNFRDNHALYSNTFFASTPVRDGKFDYDFRSAEFELRIQGHWVSPGVVKGSIFQVGLPTEYFTVSLDVPNP